MENIKKDTENKEEISDSEKINYLISKIEKLEIKVNAIDKTINPPFWKKFLSWFFSNFWTLLFLAVIGYFLWQVWEVVQTLQEGLNQVELKISGVKTSVSTQLQNFSEILEPLRKINLEKLKFWK